MELEYCHLNDGLDPNNPAHQIVMELNIKNQKLYGEYHPECGLFERYCRCLVEKN